MPLNPFEAVLLGLAVLAYLVAFTAAAFGLARRAHTRTPRVALLIAFACHGALIAARGWRLGHTAISDAPSTLLFVTWCATLVSVIIDIAQGLRSLPLFLSPPIAMALALAAFGLNRASEGTELPEQGRAALVFHIVTAIVAYGAFAFAAVLSVMYLFLEGQLKRKKLGPWLDLPALDRLERVSGRFVISGFAFLTLSLVVGFVYQAHTPTLGENWLSSPKTVLALATWVACGVLVALRMRALLAGRRQVVATLIVFGLVLLTYLGAPLIVGGEHLPAGTARRD